MSTNIMSFPVRSLDGNNGSSFYREYLTSFFMGQIYHKGFIAIPVITSIIICKLWNIGKSVGNKIEYFFLFRFIGI